MLNNWLQVPFPSFLIPHGLFCDTPMGQAPSLRKSLWLELMHIGWALFGCSQPIPIQPSWPSGALFSHLFFFFDFYFYFFSLQSDQTRNEDWREHDAKKLKKKKAFKPGLSIKSNWGIGLTFRLRDGDTVMVSENGSVSKANKIHNKNDL